MKKLNTLQRLKIYIDYKGLTNKDFEISVGFSNGAFASQLKNNRTIGVDKLENILLVYPEINGDWLLTGKGEMLRTEGSAGPPSADQAEILELLRWKVERLEEENKKLKGEVSSLKRELDQSPPGIRKSELKK